MMKPFEEIISDLLKLDEQADDKVTKAVVQSVVVFNSFMLTIWIANKNGYLVDSDVNFISFVMTYHIVVAVFGFIFIYKLIEMSTRILSIPVAYSLGQLCFFTLTNRKKTKKKIDEKYNTYVKIAKDKNKTFDDKFKELGLMPLPENLVVREYDKVKDLVESDEKTQLYFERYSSAVSSTTLVYFLTVIQYFPKLHFLLVDVLLIIVNIIVFSLYSKLQVDKRWMAYLWDKKVLASTERMAREAQKKLDLFKLTGDPEHLK